MASACDTGDSALSQDDASSVGSSATYESASSSGRTGNRRSIALQTATVHRTNGSFNLSIKGGREHGIPILVSKVLKVGLHANKYCPLIMVPQQPQGQRIEVGSEIVSVNGESLAKMSHEEAVKILGKAGDIAVLELRPDLIRRREYSVHAAAI